MSPAPRRNLLPGNCSTCRKTTGSCGLVSGPQGKKKKKKSVVVISAFYHIAPCLWCSTGEKSSFSALGDAATSVEMGQRCQPCLSTGFEGRQAAHSKMMRRNPVVTGPAQPSACYAHRLHIPGRGLGSGRSRGAGTLLRGYRAAKAFPILWLLWYSVSARAGNHGHGPGTPPFQCSSLDSPVGHRYWCHCKSRCKTQRVRGGERQPALGHTIEKWVPPTTVFSCCLLETEKKKNSSAHTG